MRVAVDVSLYPIADDFIPPIKDVIERLHGNPAVEVSTNAMSTQLRGDYDDVMDLLKKEIGTTFDQCPKAVFTIRILTNPITD